MDFEPIKYWKWNITEGVVVSVIFLVIFLLSYGCNVGFNAKCHDSHGGFKPGS